MQKFLSGREHAIFHYFYLVISEGYGVLGVVEITPESKLKLAPGSTVDRANSNTITWYQPAPSYSRELRAIPDLED